MLRHFYSLPVCAIVLCASPAFASPASDAKANADSLFEQGRALAKQEKWADACPKFEASLKSDWAAGTLLNLAVCHARVGENAKAYAELVDSLMLAQKAKRADREKICRDELAALESKIARLAVDVVTAVPSLVVSLDDKTIPTSALGVAQVIEPGMHVVRATAPGRKTYEANAALVAGDRKTIEIPELEIDTAAPAAPPPETTNKSAAVVSPPGVTSSNELQSGDSRKTVGLVVGGVGLAAIGVGTYFLLHASSLDSQKSDLASQGDAVGANDKADQARTALAISRIGIGVGVASVAVGAWLFLTAKSSSESESSAKTSSWIAPSVAPGFGGFSFGGAW